VSLTENKESGRERGPLNAVVKVVDTRYQPTSRTARGGPGLAGQALVFSLTRQVFLARGRKTKTQTATGKPKVPHHYFVERPGSRTDLASRSGFGGKGVCKDGRVDGGGKRSEAAREGARTSLGCQYVYFERSNPC
jgi:hypothetical protein